MNLLPDDLKHPSGGERLQGTASDAVRLAHKALERFPLVVKRHKFIAGGAAISSSLVVLAGVAIARRLRSGQSAEEAVASLTEEELNGQRVELPGDAEPAGAELAGVELETNGDAEPPTNGEAEPPTNGAAPEGAEEDSVLPLERGP